MAPPLAAKTAATWRSALFDVLGANVLLKHALSLVLSSSMDRPRNAWDGTYLPAQLERELLATRGMGNAPGEPFVDRNIVLPPAFAMTGYPCCPPGRLACWRSCWRS
jgi:hypothetical protein